MYQRVSEKLESVGNRGKNGGKRGGNAANGTQNGVNGIGNAKINFKNGFNFNPRSVLPAFEMKFSARAMMEFILESLLIFLFASVPNIGIALSLGFFSGLVFARQNLLLLSPVYIVSGIVFALNWWTLLYVATPILILLLLYLVFFLLKRNVPMYSIAIVTALSLLPYVIRESLVGGNIFFAVMSLAISVVFTFCSAIICYALLYRRESRRFTLDEQICGGIFMAVFAFALKSLSFDGFNIAVAVCGFCVLLSSDCFSHQTTLFTSLLIGIGAALSFNDISYLGVFVLLGGVAVALSPFTRFASAAGMITSISALWLAASYGAFGGTGGVFSASLGAFAAPNDIFSSSFGVFSAAEGANSLGNALGAATLDGVASSFGAVGWKSLVLLSVGVLVYLCFPQVLRSKIKDYSKSSNRAAVVSLVNRNRHELSAKLFSVSDVFYEMSKSTERAVDIDNCFTPSKLASEVAKNYCGKCPDREDCFSQLGGDTAVVIEPMATAAMSRGRVTILDMPTFITSRCRKMNNLAAVINSSAEVYQKRKGDASGLETGKRLMSEQFAGVALVLDALARESGETVSFFEDKTDIIETELLKHNIVASEAVVSGLQDDTRVTLTVRKCDANKAVLPRIVSALLKQNLEIVEVKQKGEQRVVHLESAPTFEVAYGVAEAVRSGEGVSGDSKSILCPSRQQRLFAISDGMGSGDAASKASRDTIKMIESFYRAGFDHSIILSLVNKLLLLNGGEIFSALDIAVIDTVTGGMDMIKLGSADSFIIHGNGVEVVSSACPPAGILECVQPVTNRLQLYDGDLVVMMSDGVFDALDTLGVRDTIARLDTKNPQTIADGLLSAAKELGAEDDCTALVLRLVCV